MPKRLFEDADFLAAARDLAAAGGPASVTVSSVTGREHPSVLSITASLHVTCCWRMCGWIPR